MRGIILEGVSGSGKSRLCTALQVELARVAPSTSKVFVSEHVTERALEGQRRDGELCEVDVIAHLANVLETLRPMNDAISASGLADRGARVRPLAVIERFLLGHMAHMQMINPQSWINPAGWESDLERLRTTMQACGLTTVVLHVDDAVIPDRIADSMARRNHRWSSYLDGIGGAGEVADYFASWQKRMLESAASVLPTARIVDVSAVVSEQSYADLAQSLATELVSDIEKQPIP